MDSTKKERKINKHAKKVATFTVLVASQWSGKGTVTNTSFYRFLFPSTGEGANSSGDIEQRFMKTPALLAK